MRPVAYMRSVADRNDVMQRIPVLKSWELKLLSVCGVIPDAGIW